MAALAATFGVWLLLAATASGRDAAKVFSDPVGDAGTGPDIRAMSFDVHAKTGTIADDGSGTSVTTRRTAACGRTRSRASSP